MAEPAAGMRVAGRAALLVLLGAAAAGCVERELRVESDPPGADLYIDGVKAGTTPHVEPFTFYGARRLTFRLDGHVPQETVVPIRPPWFQVLPLDFFFELLWPWTLRDERRVSVVLEPLSEADPEALIERARSWREEARRPAAGEK
ncbi:MAG: PEGA domain-containing protein [Candidatus Brocadiae bacterium]|nr:PEGA domain-containing protein [Candidatus Brocadiia bacterium]